MFVRPPEAPPARLQPVALAEILWVSWAVTAKVSDAAALLPAASAVVVISSVISTSWAPAPTANPPEVPSAFPETAAS